MTGNKQSGTKPHRYQQIASYYRDKILSGEFRPGDTFPARHEIMQKHAEGGKSLGRATADKVIDVLSAQGLIVRRPRQAPIVADRTRFGTTLSDRAASRRATGDAHGVDEHSKITYVGMVKVPVDIAPSLGVEIGDFVFRRSRVTYREGAPIAMSTSYYTEDTVRVTPELTEPESIRSGSRELAAERLGCPLQPGDEGDEIVTARLAFEAEQRALGLDGTHAVVTETLRIVALRDGRVVEVAKKVQSGMRPLLFRTRVA